MVKDIEVMHIDRPGRVSQGVFDFCALEGLGAWLVARQPQLGSSQQLLLFDLIVPNEPGYVANVFDLRVPAVWVPCIQQHVALPPILSLLSPVSHFVEHMHGDQPTTSGPAKQHLSAVETLRVSLPPAAAHALARRLATALARRSRASQRRSREPAAHPPLEVDDSTAGVRVPAPGPRWASPAASLRPTRRSPSPATEPAAVGAGRGR